jgi:hypothetical protein
LKRTHKRDGAPDFWLFLIDGDSLLITGALMQVGSDVN